MSAALSFEGILTLAPRLGVTDAPCPVCSPMHNPRRRVLRIWRERDDFAGFVCARCDVKGWARGHIAAVPFSQSSSEWDSRTKDNEVKRTASALAIWNEARDPRRTPVQDYLTRPKSDEGRGLTLPDDAAGEAIRFHATCPFAGERVPAMVCLVRDVITNEPKAIHRTALSPDGRKVNVRGADRLSLGPVGGGAIKLTPDDQVTRCLGIAEGVETALSMRHVVAEFGTSPVWSVLSAGGIKRFPTLRGIESLWVAVDHDPTGLEAARTVAGRWRAFGAEAFLITPTAERADLNDLFRAGVAHA